MAKAMKVLCAFTHLYLFTLVSFICAGGVTPFAQALNIIPGPQKRGTGGTLTVVGNGH
jgi:hypothetical protein